MSLCFTYIAIAWKAEPTRDRQLYFPFINLFLCLCTKTTHSLQSFPAFLKNFEMLKNVLLWASTIHVITKYRPFRSISNRFVFIWPPFGQFWPNFCQKLISAISKYTGCSYKMFNHFIHPFVLYRGNKFVFKLLTITLMKIKI